MNGTGNSSSPLHAAICTRDRKSLLIIGASVRAAAMSAVRGGFQPAGIDLFADSDLRAIAPVIRVDDFPDGLLSAAQQVPPACWMYTGGLENHPDIVAAISRRHMLVGNPPDVLRHVRNPFRLAEALASAGLPALAVRSFRNPPPRNGQWLRKPLRSAGGRGIALWKTHIAGTRESDRLHYFQQRAAGTPMSAVFLATKIDDFIECRLLGLTRQLVGESEWHAEPFSYCGSVGPVSLPPLLMQQVRHIGKTVSTTFSLRGLFGVDLIVDSSSVWCVEVNPRYPASAEVLEYAAGLSLVALHWKACRSFEGVDSSQEDQWEWPAATTFMNEGRTNPDDRKPEQRNGSEVWTEAAFSGCIIGKGVLFAERRVCWPSSVAGNFPDFSGSAALKNRMPGLTIQASAGPVTTFPDSVGAACFDDNNSVLSQDFAVPQIADVPPAGTVIAAGHPLCTVFAAGATMTECLNRLFERSRQLKVWLEM